jgi:hypothetical protein
MGCDPMADIGRWETIRFREAGCGKLPFVRSILQNAIDAPRCPVTIHNGSFEQLPWLVMPLLFS